MPSAFRRPIVLLCSGLFALILLVLLCIPQTRPPLSPSLKSSLSSSAKYYGPSSTRPLPHTRRRIHFLLPATSLNPDACKLLLTSQILNYPPPILIGWGGHGRWNGSSNHLFKFPLFDEYFSTLGPESDDDLVFLFDAYDIWLQLPVEVMIQRYLLAISKENRRLEREVILDAPAAGSGNRTVRNTVLFGADRLCWPQDPTKQIPCWSSPESLLPEHIMGPSTDHGDLEHVPAVRPRHLNSGTLVGRLADVRDFWNTTYDIVEKLLPISEWKLKNSDQHYLHVLWNLQQEARLGLANGTMVAGGEYGDGLVRRREFGVTVDGEGDVFQESLYHEYVTWMRFNHSSSSSSSSGKAEDNRRHAELGRLDRLVLDDDIASSPGPFSADAVTSLLDGRGWEQMPLGMNVLTGTVFPLFHITPLKYLRDLWWGRMWFHPHAEALLLAGRRKWVGDGWREGRDGTKERVVATVEGVEYVAVEGVRGVGEGGLEKSRSGEFRKGGVWNDLGVWMAWEEVCGEHEGKVFNP